MIKCLVNPKKRCIFAKKIEQYENKRRLYGNTPQISGIKV